MRSAAIVLAVTLGVYLLVDVAAGFVIGPLHRPAPDFSTIPGFRGQPYATPAFAAEYTEMQSFDTVLGTSLLWPALRQGTYFNVDRVAPTGAHYRRTINECGSKAAVRRVLVIGGSLVFGPAVPDADTIASLISRRLNREDPSVCWQVLNAGVDGAVSGQELARFGYELAHGLKPDLVVAVDGPVDLAQGVYEGRPGSNALQGRGLIGELIHRYVPLHIYDWLRFRLGGLATARGWRRAPAHLKDPARVAELTRQSVDIYVRNELALAELARSAGARFLLAINPTLGSSSYARDMPDIAYATDLSRRLYPGQSEMMPQIRPALAEAAAKLRAQGIDALDLSGLLRDKTVDVFVEPSHFNATGNDMIADAIVREILHPAPP